jgi:hypothetical protein
MYYSYYLSSPQNDVTVQELNLSDNNIGHEGVRDIESLLTRNHQIRKLVSYAHSVVNCDLVLKDELHFACLQKMSIESGCI